MARKPLGDTIGYLDMTDNQQLILIGYHDDNLIPKAPNELEFIAIQLRVNHIVENFVDAQRVEVIE